MQKLLNTIYNQRAVLLVTILYGIAVTFFSSFHELWRDEVVLISFIADSDSLFSLIRSLQNYGHPPLFHILVYCGYQIFPHYVVLKIVNISICVAAIYLFLLKSPFSWTQRILFICGALPLYNYPVINRNYGLSLLLIFIVCILYKDRFKRIIPFSIVLFLLAHVHAHSFIIVMAICFSMTLEFFFIKENVSLQKPRPWHVMIGALIISACIGSFVVQSMPNSSSIIFSTDSLTIPRVIKAFLNSIFIPGKAFNRLFAFESSLFVNTIIFGMYIYLLRKLHLFSIFASSVIMLSMFFILVYPSNQLRHQASLYLLMIIIFWIDSYYSKEHNIPTTFLKNMRAYLSTHKTALFTFLLIIHVSMAYTSIKEDIVSPYSSSKDFAAFVSDDPTLNDAIIMAEPGAMLEALPYYLDNQLFIYREERFGKVRSFTTEMKTAASMEDLLRSAKKLQNEYNKKILILLDKRIKSGGPFKIEHPYSCFFEYSEDSLKAFLSITEKIADFDNSLSYENYGVYLLK